MAADLFRGFPNSVCDVGIVYKRMVASSGSTLVIEVGVRIQVSPARWDSWCRDASLWPDPRPYTLFREWFDVRFYDLVEDLGDTELTLDEEEDHF